MSDLNLDTTLSPDFLQKILASQNNTNPVLNPDALAKNKALNDLYLKNITTMGSVPGSTSSADVYNAFAGTKDQPGSFGKGISSLLNYFASPEGKQIIAGAISGRAPWMGGALEQQAETQKAQNMNLAAAVQSQNMEKLKQMGEAVKSENQNIQEAAKNKSQNMLEGAKFGMENMFKGAELSNEAKRFSNEVNQKQADLKQKQVDEQVDLIKQQKDVTDDDKVKAVALIQKGITPEWERSFGGTIIPGGKSHQLSSKSVQDYNNLQAGTIPTIGDMFQGGKVLSIKKIQ